MAELVPMPVLDTRDEIKIAALAIARVSGGLTPDRIRRNIEVQRELLAMAEAGNLPQQPVCPELTNANPSSPHTVLIEAFAWLVGLIMYAINQVPWQNVIAFVRLFGITLREPTPATTTLRFAVAPPVGQGVTIPAGTQVEAGEGLVFETVEELNIAAGQAEGFVEARRTELGALSLAPDTVTNLLDAVAWVTSVTNPEAVESGSDAETVDAAVERARNYQRRGERLVNARDLEDAIREDVMGGNGIVRAFDLIKDGDWQTPQPGHITAVVMTRTGSPVSADVRAAINTHLAQVVGSVFVYIKDPEHENFNVSATVKLDPMVSQSTVLAEVERRLTEFYRATEPGNFGRRITRSEIIAIIEGTTGVDRIEPQPDGQILASPLADVPVPPYKLPRLLSVELNVSQ